MNRVIIDKNCKIGIKNSQLIVEDKKIPLRYINFLILAGDVEFDTKTIMQLLKKDISILIAKRGFGLMHPVNPKNGELKKRQYLALNRDLEIARGIIKKKILNSIEFLKEVGIKIEFDFEKIDKVKDKNELLGLEGSFAKIYFKEYFSLFDKTLTKGYRSKRPPQDVVNAMMSFLYTLLYYEIANRLISFGFEVQISYLHESFREHFSLASDIEEVFRSRVDRFVYTLFRDKKLKKSDFTAKGGIFLRDEKRKELWIEFKNFFEKLEIDKEIGWLRKELS